MSDTDWQLPWHAEIANAPARFKVAVVHRKGRKTLLAIKELNRWAGSIPGVYWLVEPTLAQGKRIVWDDPDMFARNVDVLAWNNRNITDHYLQYPNGSKVYLIGAKGENALRGPNPRGVILDEYDDMSSDVWPTIQPVMTANPKAWCWFMGTYKGKKDLYAKMQYAVSHPDWFGLTLPASKSGIISQDALEEARATTPQAFYDMEYECVPVEGGTSFFSRIRENIWHGRFGSLDGKDFDLGIDLAKYNDWTVIFPVCTTERIQEWGQNESAFYAGMPERFNQIDWPLQKARIKAAWGLYNKGKIKIDGTGIGSPVSDDLIADGLKPLEVITFTSKMRMDLLRNLQIMLAQDMVKLPEYPQLLDELESFNYEVTKGGRISIEVPDGKHDDCVMALALAVWQIKKTKPKATTYATTTQFHDQTKDLWNGC